MPIRLAAIAPVLSAVPVAWTQTPTFSADDEAGTVSEYVVLGVTSTMSVTADPDCRATARTAIASPATDVTWPLTTAPNPPRPRPAPGLKDGAPLGRTDGRPEGRTPLPKPREHEPFTGWLIDTLAAVIVCGPVGRTLGWVLDWVVPVAGIAVTHTPTDTADAGTLATWVKVVLDEYVTVVWPLVGFCTSTLPGESAATSPKAPGNCRLPVAGAEVVGVAATLAAPVPLDPQADSTPAEASAAATSRAGRYEQGLSVMAYSLRRASMGASRAARLAG